MDTKSSSIWIAMQIAPLSEEGSGKPVTNQVTTTPGIASQNATRRDSAVSSSCGNATPGDCVRRIEHA